MRLVGLHVLLGLSTVTLATVLAAACKGPAAAPAPELTTAELLDPASCQGCHPDAFADWSGSMHAYAADDPVFLAMEARAQRETGGAIGTFCTQCHAPMAVLTGALSDGGADGGARGARPTSRRCRPRSRGSPASSATRSRR